VGGGGGGFEWNISPVFSFRVNPELFGAVSPSLLLPCLMNFKIYLLRFFSPKVWTWEDLLMPRLLSTNTISQPCPLPRPPPPPPFTLSCILRLIWKHKQGPCSSPCIGKIIGMTFLCRNVPGFCQQLFTPFFLVSTNSLFSWNLYFRISNPLCFIRLGEPLASNPRLLRFCTQYANDFANPANPVLIPVFLFLNEQWRGGGGVEGSTVKG
jgi:hypothetical protein